MSSGSINTLSGRLLGRAIGGGVLGSQEISARNPSWASTPRGATEELANSFTHGLGLALSLAGLYGLVHATQGAGATELVIGCRVYGISLVLTYAASAFYHGWRQGKVKRALLVADHVAIYGLIVGTYTPLALASAHGHLHWIPVALVWGLGLTGSAFKVARTDRLDDDSALPYVVIAWAAVAFLGRHVAALPPGTFAWLLAGGLFYLVGLIFFARDDRPYNHTIWHLFVMAGSLCHYCVVVGYAVPLAA
jgi:hemolysin III